MNETNDPLNAWRDALLTWQQNLQNLDPSGKVKNFAAGFEQWMQQNAVPGMAAWAPTASLPGIGANREQQALWQRILELTARYQELQSKLAEQWASVGGKAAQAFSAEMTAATEAGKSFANLKSLYDRWIDHAEKSYSAQAHQKNYAGLLADLTNTLNELNAKQRELMESCTKQFDLPTRAELNTVHLRLKEMQRQLDQVRGPSAQAAAKPQPVKKPRPEKKPSRAASKKKARR